MYLRYPILTLTPIYFYFIIRSIVAFQRLIKYEYGEHRSEWENDGNPCTIFWRPPESNYWLNFSLLSPGKKIWYKWIFTTPDWIKNDDRALVLHRELRKTTGAAFFCTLCVMAPIAIILNLNPQLNSWK